MNKNWDLSTLFKNWEEWEKVYDGLLKEVDKILEYKGKLKDFNIFDEFYIYFEDFRTRLIRCYYYANFNSDLNKKDTDNDARLKKVQYLFSRFSNATSWIDPEIMGLGEKVVYEFVEKSDKLKEYKFSFDKLFRNKEHILNDDNEKILADFSAFTGTPSGLHTSLAVADNSEKEVTLNNGEVIKVTSGNFRSYLSTLKNQEDRRKVFEAVFEHYSNNKNTFAGIYNQTLQRDLAVAKSRNYTTCVESKLFGNNIPVSVYESLIETTKNNTEPIKKYIELRKKFFNIDKYRTYDRFLSFGQSDRTYTYEDAIELFNESIKEFPQTFRSVAEEALASGHVDVYEKDGKRTGAYSARVPESNPFILLNFDGRMDSVFTTVHEAGHSMHSMFSQRNQPKATADYTIFVAEIASTFNEHVLLDYLVKNSDSKEERIVLLQQAIDDILSTFYRQALFADFEYQAHKMVENGQPITHVTLSNIMIDLYKQYYGLDLVEEKIKQYVWAYIPHLYFAPFYVYQYATSFAASLKIYEDVKNNVDGAFERYLGLLKSGGSDYPVNQAKDAGVDLTTKAPFLAVVNRLDDLVSKLEQELKD